MPPGSALTLHSDSDEDKKRLMALSITDLISILRTAYQTVDYDRVEDVLIAKETKLKTEIGVLSGQLEMERSERMNVEEQLKAYKEQCEKGKKAEERYERLLEAVKKNNSLDDGNSITELRMMNRKLEDENCRAESEAESWKRKCEELNRRLLMVEKGARSFVNEDTRVEMGGNAEDRSGVGRNNDPGISTEAIDEMELEMNEVVAREQDYANAAADSSPLQRILTSDNAQADVENAQLETEDTQSDTEDEQDDEYARQHREAYYQRGGWHVEVQDSSGKSYWRNMFERDVWLLPKGDRVMVHFNEYGQPDDNGGGLLGQFLSNIAINPKICPIRYPRWTKFLAKLKNDLFRDIIQAHFVVTEEHKKYCMTKLGHRWRQGRLNLYNGLQDGTKTKEELLKKVPSQVPFEDWKKYVEYRMDPKTQELAKTNKRNRAQQTIHHTGGSKTHARKKAEMEAQHRRKINRTELWIEVNKHKDGTVSPSVQAIIDKIVEKQSQMGSANEIINYGQDDVLTEALGVPERPGRVRALGLGPTPTQVFTGFGSRYSRTAKVEQLEEHLRQSNEKVTSLEREIEELRALKSKLPQLTKNQQSSTHLTL
ncbi:uncharacterized protein LOC129303053 isoform X1 [Prosopis cineraria]|uniref:uncharacterized protein LOC129303053 isoform X1 n=1 Tax=Prosopis cineraria TaxID=364024 RepID=UPI00240F541B|nr:uncharacterized protein LOC129303053 isoform X1 [Prosopis cineraria]